MLLKFKGGFLLIFGVLLAFIKRLRGGFLKEMRGKYAFFVRAFVETHFRGFFSLN